MSTNDELRTTSDEGEVSGRQMVLPGMETADDRPHKTQAPPAPPPPDPLNTDSLNTDSLNTDSLNTDSLNTDSLNTDSLNTDPLNTDPPPPSPPLPHLYFPRPTAAEQRILTATAAEPDLQPEVELVRLVLRRLLVHLDESAGELPPEETRRVAALVFTGARTVALLLGKRPSSHPETEKWMTEALQEMKEIGKQG